MIFKKKKKEDVEEEDSDESQEDSKPKASKVESLGEASLPKLTAELEKLKAQFSSFYELQKASAERFTRVNEQIGELRAMILDQAKETNQVQAKATQAIDLVQSVQPDKLMVDVRKVDNKIEMVKSKMESQELIINNALSEMKEMRIKINSLKGLEESVKLAEEVRSAWIENKKIDASITKHSQKVETIYSEMWKRFSGFERFASVVADLDKSVKQVAADLDGIKVKITTLSEKKEVEDLIVKLETFEKYIDNVVSSLNKRISSFERDITREFNAYVDKSMKLLKGFEKLVAKTPSLDKYFNLLKEEAGKAKEAENKVEKIQMPGKDEKIEIKPKKNFFRRIIKKGGEEEPEE